MKRFPLTLIFIALAMISTNFYSQRILYVDQFFEILGNQKKEKELLDFAVENNFDKLILYDLHKVNKAYPMANTYQNQILADFISLAKETYHIKEVSGSGENPDFFISAIDAYNKSRKKTSEKFDAYNLEYEYWDEMSSKNGGYYCKNYLEKNGKKCNRSESFKFYIQTLQTMQKLANSNTHKVKVEAYVGKFTQSEIVHISKYVDRLLVHVYVSHPKSGFYYANERLKYLSNIQNAPKISIIYSSELFFMGGWFKYNSLKKAENIFIDTMKRENYSIMKNLDFTNFTYYNYHDLKKSVEYYTNQIVSTDLTKTYTGTK